MIKQTNSKNGFKSIQFKDKIYEIGIVYVSDLDWDENIDIEDFDEFMNFFLKRKERVSYCCDNCCILGIILDPTIVDLQQLKFSTSAEREMYVYILRDDNTDREVVFYSSLWFTCGVDNPNFYTL